MQATLDRLIVLKEERPEKIGSIILTDTARQPFATGVVFRAGPGTPSANGDTIYNNILEGDRILFAANVGTEITLNGTMYLLMREIDVIAVLEQEDRIGS
jgi:chaperonin GroES